MLSCPSLGGYTSVSSPVWSAVVSVWCSLSISTSYRGLCYFSMLSGEMVRMLQVYCVLMAWLIECGFSCCCVLLVLLYGVACRLLCSEVWKIPGYRGRVPPGGLHFCKEGVWRVGVDVFNFHDTGKIWMFRTSAAIISLFYIWIYRLTHYIGDYLMSLHITWFCKIQ